MSNVHIILDCLNLVYIAAKVALVATKPITLVVFRRVSILESLFHSQNYIYTDAQNCKKQTILQVKRNIQRTSNVHIILDCLNLVYIP